ncbi:hypothetical protein CICLE_v10011631mg [Citrus x clementina]|uniref:Bulb-type lectin domain-containing protein n=1 Tax=Citrus clementina TaxID=85681 RepID=V4SUW1_CITCL|nr:hypothetical protein CICLE_v10011631mg [Citrus x clementina]
MVAHVLTWHIMRQQRKQPSFVPNYLFGFVVFVMFSNGFCNSDIQKGYKLTLAVPAEYSLGFIGRAFLIETGQIAPNFRAAVSIEAVNGKFSCSLEVLLGDVKVWNSGHYSRFYVSEKCVLELTKDGDLQLKGPNDRVGWLSGTSRQGVERLQILRTGNLVLVDVVNRVKWQSFNFPTDVMLWGQRLNVATRLTSFPGNSTEFYSFEIQRYRIALFLHSGLFNDKGKKIAQIYSQRLQPLRFLSLGNRTGNLALYHYSANDRNFQASFQAINKTCDLPLGCKPCEICTFTNSCSCIGLLTKKEKDKSDCGCGEIAVGLCGRNRVEMLELEGVGSVLRDGPKMVNVSKEECASMCISDCKCVGVLYSSAELECFVYGVVMGVKQVEKRSGLIYMVKVAKGTQRGRGKRNLKKWVLILVGVVDGLIIVLVFGGLAYYLIRRRRKKSLACDNSS